MVARKQQEQGQKEIKRQMILEAVYFRFMNTQLLSNIGHYSPLHGKGPSTTSWIWNIHASTHEIEDENRSPYSSKVMASHS